MKTIFKKFDIAGLAVMLLAFFVAVGFTASDMKLAPQWYEVEINGDPTEPNDQEIGEQLGNPPAFPCSEPEGTIYAIQLDMKLHNTVPATVAEADSLHTLDLIEIKERRHFD